MLKASEIKEKILEEDIFKLLEQLEANPVDRGSYYEAITICHNGDSHKLFYYKNSEKFMCYTNCGSMDIFSFIGNTFNKSFVESSEFLINKFNLNRGFNTGIDSTTISSPLRNRGIVDDNHEKIRILDDNITKSYYEKYYSGWIKEGISVNTMKKFGIKYSISDNQIIIPHYSVDGNLIGVRARNLNDYEIKLGRKYIPVFYKGRSLKYPTGENLYGLNFNKETINTYHTIVLFEAEKSVLKLNSSGLCISVGLNGTHLGKGQMKLLNELDIDEVIIAVDKEFTESNTTESSAYAMKITSIFKQLINRYRVSVLWDNKGLLDKKDSPIDKGRAVFNELLKDRVFL